MKDPRILKQMWNAMDYNGNGVVSLSELERWVVEHYPLLNHRPALEMAFATTQDEDGGQSGERGVHKQEFNLLLAAIFYFNKLFWLFNEVDGDDRRMDFQEFIRSLVVVSANMD